MTKNTMKVSDISLTHIQIRDALPALKWLQNQPVGARAGLIVARQGRALADHARDAEEVRVSLLRKYAVKDDNGEPIEIPKLDENGNPIANRTDYKLENQEALNEEWTEVMLQAIEVSVPLIPLESLDKPDVVLTPVHMMALEPLLSE